MGFDLDHRGPDSRAIEDLGQMRNGSIRQSDGSRGTSVHLLLERTPGLNERDVIVVDELSVIIAWFLVIAGPETERRMNEIEIDIIEPE